MCCKGFVRSDHHNPELAASILAIGQFVPIGPTHWQRKTDTTYVNAYILDDRLELSLSPSISMAEHHADKRTSGGIYFEIMARYAEKVEGEISQVSLVASCLREGSPDLVIARYPHQPLTFDSVCPGFQAVFLTEGLDTMT